MYKMAKPLRLMQETVPLTSVRDRRQPFRLSTINFLTSNHTPEMLASIRMYHRRRRVHVDSFDGLRAFHSSFDVHLVLNSL